MNSLIFIGGVPRSGTSLVQKILDMHSQIYAGPEFDHLNELSKVYRNMKRGVENQRQVFYYDKKKLQENFGRLINDIFRSKIEKEGVQFLSEKTPSNVLVFNELIELFPEAKFIFVVRDPRANINSFKNVASRASEFGDKVPVGNDLFNDLNLINQYIWAGNDFHLKHGKSCHLLRYESLLKDPKTEIQNLCDFIGIPFELQMLDLGSKESDGSRLINSGNSTVRAWSTVGMLEKNIDAANIDAWKRYLSKRDIGMIDNFFMLNKYACLDAYSFNESNGLLTKATMLPMRIKNWMKRKIRKAIRI